MTFDDWLNELQPGFSGWDFSYLTTTGRMSTAPLPWGYTSRILPFVRQAQSLVDMGTGGGEKLSLLAPLPPQTWATEAYPPNLAIATKRLSPLGVRVVAIDHDDRLPFAAGQFELVINQHESYAPAEVYRILKPSGRFITQQVGGQDCLELNRMLQTPEPDNLGWNLDQAARDLNEAGFHIEQKEEAFPQTRFFDIAAVIFYLSVIEWQFPDFSIAKYRPQLGDIFHRIESDGFLNLTSHRFYIQAQRTANR